MAKTGQVLHYAALVVASCRAENKRHHQIHGSILQTTWTPPEQTRSRNVAPFTSRKTEEASRLPPPAVRFAFHSATPWLKHSGAALEKGPWSFPQHWNGRSKFTPANSTMGSVVRLSDLRTAAIWQAPAS